MRPMIRIRFSRVSLILRGRDLSEFELRIAGYQFPEIESDEFDANWLVIEGRVAPADERAWEFRDPSLLTWEVEGLCNWLEVLALGQDVREGEDFLEPNLRFEVAKRDRDTITIRIYFELESRPPWFFADTASMDDLWIDLRVDSDDLRSAAEDLRRDLAMFPQRPL
jgi:hypothetical protein